MAAPTAGAASFSVTGTADGTSACAPSGSCTSLRSAVAAASAADNANTITLPAGTFTLTSGELQVTDGKALTVTGAGAGRTIIDGNAASRIFELTGEGTSLTVSGVTLQNGKSTGNDSGGAIEDSGLADQITIDNSTLTQNSVTGWGSGGAIDSQSFGTVTVTDSTISHNSTDSGPGGGIAAMNLQMSGSTVSYNSTGSGSGGGVYIGEPFCLPVCGGRPVHADGLNLSPSIVNSTIVGNSTGDGDGSGDGGGVMVDIAFPQLKGLASVRKAAALHAAQLQPPSIGGLVSLVGDTIVGNSSVNGHGGNVSQGIYGPFSNPVWIQGSIIGAGIVDGGPTNCSLNPYVGFDGGSNLVFSESTGDKCFPTPAANDILPGDPRLANGPGLDTDSSGNFVLADNGGPTQTIALLPGSPAIDAVTNLAEETAPAPVHSSLVTTAQPGCADVLGLPLAVDQRGAQRPDVATTGCDIGAFESGAAPLVLSGSVTPNPGGVGKPVNYSFTATNDGPSFGTQSTFDVTLPPGATFDSATPSQGSCTETSATTVHCTVGVIPDGTASVAIAVTPNSAGAYAVTATASDRESGASAPLTLSANVNGTTTTTASILLPKPSTQVRACVSRRDFPIHVQNLRPLHIASATVYLNGLAVRTVRGKHLAAAIDLRQLPKGTFTVTIVARQSSGHVLRGKRTYHTCSVKLAGHKHLYL